MKISALLLALAALTCAYYPAHAEIVRNEFRVVADLGIEIAVREVRDDGPGAEDRPPLLLVHGARVPGIASFDLPVPGGSLAADLAAGGHLVYIIDIRGYGRSTRPAEMDGPPGGLAPLVNSHEAVRDIGAAVAEIRRRNANRPVALLGWATGGHWAGMYASLHPEAVSRLVLYNSLYGGTDGHASLGRGSDMEDPAAPGRFNSRAFGAYRFNSAASLLSAWDRSIPVDDKSLWRAPEIAAAYQREAMASDNSSPTRTPPTFRSPSGAMEDSFYLATGRQLWDAAPITAHVLIIRSENDFWSRPADADLLLQHLASASSRRLITLPGATHFAHLDRPERGRAAFVAEVLRLLGSEAPQLEP